MKKAWIAIAIFVVVMGSIVALFLIKPPPTVLYNGNRTLSVTIGTEEFINSWKQLDTDDPNEIKLLFCPNGIIEREVNINITVGELYNSDNLLTYAAIVYRMFTDGLSDGTGLYNNDRHAGTTIKFNGEPAIQYEYTPVNEIKEMFNTLIIAPGSNKQNFIIIHFDVDKKYANAPERSQIYDVLNTIKEIVK